MAADPRELLERLLRRFTRAVEGVESGDTRALHRARVASRRLRELVPLLPLDGAASARLSRRLRKVTVELGRVRELDVAVLLLDELHESGRFQAAAIERVRGLIEADRLAARERLATRLPAEDLRKTAARLKKISAGFREGRNAALKGLRHEDGGAGSRGASGTRGGAAPSGTRRGAAPSGTRGGAGLSGLRSKAWRWAIEARVARRAAAVDRAVADAGAIYLPDRLHDVRIAVKKLRYALELAVDSGVSDRHADVTALKRTQTRLGRLHDLQLLVDRARGALPGDAARDRAALDAFTAGVEDDCRRLHAQFVRDRASLLAIAARGRRIAGPAALRRVG